MKKIIISLIILIIVIFGLLLTFNKKSKDNNLKHIKVAEVAHSIFYAPWYVAIENDYFKDEGLDVEVILTSGANNVVAAVLSNDVNIGFCGPEATIYIYNEGEKDYIKTFSGLTKRDGQFTVSREKKNNFNINDLIGSEVLAGRIGGMPELNFENALRNSNVNVNSVNINTTVEFGALSGAFISGVGDYVNLFEPNATQLEKMGFGYVVGSIGELSGEMPYTAFNARSSYIEKNKDTIKKFTNAISRGLEFVNENDSETIANVIIDEFPDTSINDMVTIIDRYKKNDSWLLTPYISEDSFKNLEDIMIKSNQIDNYVNYNDLIVNYYE